MVCSFKHGSTTRKLKRELATPEMLAQLFNLKLSTLNLGDDEGNAYVLVAGCFNPPLPESGELDVYGQEGVDGAKETVAHLDARVSGSQAPVSAKSLGKRLEVVLDSTKALKESSGSLISAPEACMLVEKLTILAACTSDPSLVNAKMSIDKFKRLKTPHSFRASLYQITTAICNSFRVADRSMGVISAALHMVPMCIEDVLEAMADGDDGTADCVKLNLNQIAQACATCKEEACKPTAAFESTIQDIDELVQAATSTQSHSEEEKKRIAQLKEEYEAETALREQEAVELAEMTENQKMMVEEARKEYKEQKEKIGDMGNVFTALLFDTLSSTLNSVSSSVISLASIPGHALTSLKGALGPDGKFVETKDTRKIHEVVMRRTCTELMDILKGSTEAILSGRDDLELNLISAINFDPKSDHGKNIKKQVKQVQNALRELSSTHPETRKQYDKAYIDLKGALEVAEVIEEKHEEEQQRKVASATEGTSRMMATMEQSARESGKHYEFESQKYDQARQKLTEAKRKMSELAVKIAHAHTDEADLSSVLEYLSQGVAILVEVKASWLKMEKFFTNIQATVEQSLNAIITMFIENANRNNFLTSNSTKRLVLKSALGACGLSTQVYNCAALYQEISQKFVLPKIASVGQNLVLSKEEAKRKLVELEMDRSGEAEIEEMITKRIGTMALESDKLMKGYSDDIQKSIGL